MVLLLQTRFNLGCTILILHSQHYQKIRKESRNGGSTTSTPSKPREAKTTPASRRATKSFGNVVADDDEELFQTPTKKQKTGVKKKEEQDDVDYGGFLGQTAAQVKFENGTDHYIDVDNDEYASCDDGAGR